MKSDKVLFYFAIWVSFVLVLSCALWGGEFGFWPHDTWAYTNSEMHEFEGNGRWLAPVFHYLLHNVPQSVAWWCSIALFWYFNYTITYNYLSEIPEDSSKVIDVSLLFSFVPLFIPSLYAQFSWPAHSLSAIIVLVVMTVLVRKLPRVPVVIVGTIIVFAIHQAFAFLTLLFLIPKYSSITNAPVTEGVKKAAGAVTIWWSAFLLSYAASKSMQYLYYGRFGEIPEWRVAVKVSSVDDLFVSFSNNMKITLSHYIDVFSVQSVVLLLLSLVAVYVYLRKNRKAELSSFYVLLIIGVTMPLAVYMVTSMAGVRFPIRATFVAGASVWCVLMAFYVGLRSLSFSYVFMILFLSHPLVTAYHNVKWYAEATSGVTNVIREIEEVDPKYLDGVVILDTNIKKGIIWQIIESKVLFYSRPKIFIDIIFNNKVDSLFNELGYTNVRWCISENSFLNAHCLKIKEAKEFSKCSKLNPNVCSVGVTDDNYWLIKSK